MNATKNRPAGKRRETQKQRVARIDATVAEVEREKPNAPGLKLVRLFADLAKVSPPKLRRLSK